MKRPKQVKALLFGVVLTAMSAFNLPTASAATITVCASGCDFTTIQAAVNAAAPGDVITVAAGTYAETVSINKSLTIDGSSDDSSTGTIIDFPGTGTGVDITSSNVTLKDLRIDKGDATGEDDGRGVHLNAPNVDNIVFNGVTITGATVGLRVSGGTNVDGLTIDDSHFDGNDMGWYLYHETPAGTNVTNVNVTNTTFDNNLRKGIYAEKLGDALFDGVTVNNSGTSPTYNFNAGIDINLKWAAYQDIELRNVTTSGSGLAGTASPSAGAAIAIKARDDAPSYASPAGSLSGVTLDRVTTSGGVAGVRFGEPNKNNLGPLNVTIVNSSLGGTVAGLDNQSQATVVVNDNWWGQASGPASGQIAGPGTSTATRWCTQSDCSTLSNNANLASLSLSSGSLSPAFSASTTTYTTSVGNDVTNVTPTCTATPGANVATSGGSSLSVGSNTVSCTVTSADGSVQKVYTVTVTRAAPAPPPPDPTTTTTVPPTTSTTTPPTTMPPPTTTTVPPVVARPPDDPPPPPPPPAQPTVVNVISTPSGNGSIQVTPTGEIISTGDAPKFEGVDDKPLNAPVVNAALTPSGNGLWIVSADGGVFTQGDAPFFGSTGDKVLNAPMVNLAPTPSGKGYITVAADGGVFTFGDAKFHGSMGDKPLNAPVSGAALTPSGNGYWLLAKDGGVFSFGGAKFHGSLGNTKLDSDAVNLTPTNTGNGYWITTKSGKQYAFGDAKL